MLRYGPTGQTDTHILTEWTGASRCSGDTPSRRLTGNQAGRSIAIPAILAGKCPGWIGVTHPIGEMRAPGPDFPWE